MSTPPIIGREKNEQSSEKESGLICLAPVTLGQNAGPQAQGYSAAPELSPSTWDGIRLDPRFFDREPTSQYWWVTLMLGDIKTRGVSPIGMGQPLRGAEGFELRLGSIPNDLRSHTCEGYPLSREAASQRGFLCQVVSWVTQRPTWRI